MINKDQLKNIYKKIENINSAINLLELESNKTSSENLKRFYLDLINEGKIQLNKFKTQLK